MTEDRSKQRWIKHNWPVVAVALLVLFVYAQAVGFEFLNWDDRGYLLQNSCLKKFSWENIRRLLSPGGIPGESLYIPVSYFSFLPNALLLGLRADVAHAVNILLHALNAAMVFLIVRRLSRSGYGATIAALLFALHPVQAEAVAWAFSRRELLAACLAFVSILCFMRFLDDDCRLYGWLAFVAFVVGGLAKPSIVLLPVALVAVGLLISSKRRWLRTAIPGFAVASVIMLVLNSLSARGEGLVLSAKLFQLAWLPELVRGWFARLLLLEPLNPFYLRSSLTPESIAIGSVVLTLSLVGVFYVLSRFRAWTCLGFLVLAGAFAAPSMSIFMFANRMFYTADRYLYLPMLGIAGLVGLLASQIKRLDRHERCSTAVQIVFATCVALCSVAGLRQCSYWRNSGALHSYALTLNPVNPIALTLLGNWQMNKGARAEAMQSYRRAVAGRIGHVTAWQNIAALEGTPQARTRYLIAKYGWDHIVYLHASRLKRAGKDKEALAFMQLRCKQGGLGLMDPDFFFRLGQLNHAAGNVTTAAAAYRRTLSLDPRNSAAAYNLGMIQLAAARFSEAVSLLQHALKYGNPEDADVYSSLGAALYGLGDTAASIASLEKSLALKPNQPGVHELLARGKLRSGDREAARGHAAAAKAGGIVLKGELAELVK